MTQAPVTTQAFQFASVLLGCLCAEVAKTPAGEPCFCGMVTGNAPMPVDSCLCDRGGTRCGTAWVRLDTAYPSATFPTPDGAPRGSCTSPLAYRFLVGVVRCQPGLHPADGSPPTAAELLVAAEQEMADMRAAYQAIVCCQPPTGRGQMLLGSWLPVGAPDGLCAGGYWPVTVWDLR
jgi:hypothetical protein